MKKMLDVLREIEENVLPNWLEEGNIDDWYSMKIDYHPPHVDRVWRQWGSHRIMLHSIRCKKDDEALFHPHPWPSAMRVVSGTYEMEVGFGNPEEGTPKVSSTFILPTGSCYDMPDINTWHSVKPVYGSSLSLMVIGSLWNNVKMPYTPPAGKEFGPLSDNGKSTMLSLFANVYNNYSPINFDQVI
jgi:hypothetical protein